jgi:hypothetical protein
MKLRTKDGEAFFHLYSPSAGLKWVVDPLLHLSDYAYERMSTHPDMILQYAHRLADEKRREGHPDIEVRVDAKVSLNGRPLRPLIDPTVDLAQIPRTLAPATWVLPLTEPLPPPSSIPSERATRIVTRTQ